MKTFHFSLYHPHQYFIPYQPWRTIILVENFMRRHVRGRRRKDELEDAR
jgi:hypothetical protein